MRALPLALALASSLVLAACGSAARQVPRCPNSPQVPCMVGEECSIDSARGCEMCRCAEGFGVREEQADPIGPASPE